MSSERNENGAPPEAASPAADGEPTPGTWAHFPHGADVGVRGVAPTLEKAFAQTALALTAVLVDPARVRPTEAVPISCEAPDPELLLVDFLNALIYEMAARHMVFGRYEVSLQDKRLTGTAWGEHVEVSRHRPTVEVKGATYTSLRVAREDGNWLAQCVVDV